MDEIYIFSKTEDPVVVIGKAAGESRGKAGIEDMASYKGRVERCFKAGHMSIFEYADVAFHIGGISRSCSHQLVRHRLASPCQKSQRYVKLYSYSCEDCVIPPTISADLQLQKAFADMANSSGELYRLLLDRGVPAEDARYILPEGTKTSMSFKCNLREFYHICSLRTDASAQWEIREVVSAMKTILAAQDEQWRFLVELYDLSESQKYLRR